MFISYALIQKIVDTTCKVAAYINKFNVAFELIGGVREFS